MVTSRNIIIALKWFEYRVNFKVKMHSGAVRLMEAQKLHCTHQHTVKQLIVGLLKTC